MSEPNEASVAPHVRRGANTTWWLPLAAAVLLAAAGTWAYWDSFDGAFVLDDEYSIQRYGPIQPGTPWWKLLSKNRPVHRLSLAMNYRLDFRKAVADGRKLPIPGNGVWGYHLFNLIVHLAAAVTLMGVVRRTLLTPRLRGRFGSAAAPLAFLAALIWAVHPLHTGAVTYVVQRAESMTGLFLLLTLYFGILALSAVRRGARVTWIVLATVACVMGMGTKEVMVVAPLLVLAWDLVFSSDSFVARLGRRLGLYIPLICTYAVLIAGRILASGGGGAGIGAEGVLSPWVYAWAQFGVILHYLRLTFWPTNQCLDYLWPTPGFWKGIGPMLAILVLLAGTGIALWRRLALGFAGLWFFLILAPSSTFLPIKDVIFEHRMYLSLAAVVALVVCGAYRLGVVLPARAKAGGLASALAAGAAVASLAVAAGFVALTWWLAGGLAAAVAVLLLALGYGGVRLGRRAVPGRSAALAVSGVSLALAAALALGVATDRRNRVYRSEASVWRDVLAQYPDKARAHNNLGKALYNEGLTMQGTDEARLARAKEGVPHYHRAIELDAHYADPHYNLGVLLGKMGRFNEAIEAYEKCLAIRKDHVSALNNEGTCYAQLGRNDKALELYEKALEFSPDHAMALLNKAASLRDQKRLDEASQVQRRAIEVLGPQIEANPAPYGMLHVNLGNLLAQAGKGEEALESYKKALELDPNLVDAHLNLGLLLQNVRPAEAAEHLAKYVQAKPDDVPVRLALANVQAQMGRLADAVANCRAAIKAAPDSPEAYLGLGVALAASDDISGANTALSKVLELRPDSARGHNEMGRLLQKAGNLQAAKDYYSKAVVLDPKLAEPHIHLGRLYQSIKRGDLAVPHYNSAILLEPGNLIARNDLARLRATCSIANVRSADQAVLLSEDLCKRTGNANPEFLSTLAAAYAEAGRFHDASQTAGRGAAIAMERGNDALAKRIEAEMALYRTGRPLREGPGS